MPRPARVHNLSQLSLRSRDGRFGMKRETVPLFSLYNSRGLLSAFLCGVKGRAGFFSQNIPVNGFQMLASPAGA